MSKIDFNALRDRAYKCACEHGFHDTELSNEHLMMLVITEISEAVEADRKGKQFNNDAKETYELVQNVKFCKVIYDNYIKGSIEEELADVVIRCLDLAGLRGWDLQDTLDYVDELNEVSYFFQEHTFAEIAFDISTGTFIPESPNSVKVVIFDVWQYCLWKGIDIEWFIEQKMRYNELRENKHGKRY